MDVTETIKDRIRKVAALADRPGGDGERQAAQRQLQAMLDKYGLNLEDVVRADEPIKQYTFVYEEEWEKNLIRYICNKVAGENRSLYVHADGRSKRKKIKTLWIELTYAEHVEASYLWPQYQREYKEQMEALFTAFVIKNNLTLLKKGEGDSNINLSDEEKRQVEKARNLLKGMEESRIQSARYALTNGEKNE